MGLGYRYSSARLKRRKSFVRSGGIFGLGSRKRAFIITGTFHYCSTCLHFYIIVIKNYLYQKNNSYNKINF